MSLKKVKKLLLHHIVFYATSVSATAKTGKLKQELLGHGIKSSLYTQGRRHTHLGDMYIIILQGNIILVLLKYKIVNTILSYKQEINYCIF